MTDNPIRVLLAQAAAGRPPTRADLAQLPLVPDAAPEVRAEVAKTVDQLRALRLVGHYQQAHRLALVTAADLARHLDLDPGRGRRDHEPPTGPGPPGGHRAHDLS